MKLVQHLAGHEREVSSGTNPDRNRNKPALHSRGRLYRKGDKAKGTEIKHLHPLFVSAKPKREIETCRKRQLHLDVMYSAQ